MHEHAHRIVRRQPLQRISTSISEGINAHNTREVAKIEAPSNHARRDGKIKPSCEWRGFDRGARHQQRRQLARWTLPMIVHAPHAYVYAAWLERVMSTALRSSNR